MSDAGFRKDRIEKLFHELQYEITRGVMNHEIEELLGFDFVIPISKEGDDWCIEFHARLKPVPRWKVDPTGRRLKLVTGDTP